MKICTHTGVPPFVIDSEFRDLLPRLTDAERLLLKGQIRKEGRLLSPLIVWAEANCLIDGHHRQQLVAELRSEGIEVEVPPIAYKSFPDRYSAVRWMIQHQNARRNWTPAERAAAVLRNQAMIEQIRDEARKRQFMGKRNDLPTRGSGGDTRRFLARLAGVGEGTISRVQRVLTSGNERVIHKLLVERKLSAREAKRMVVRDEERQRLFVRAASAAANPNISTSFCDELDNRLICSDVIDGLSQIRDKTISLAFTSPPYPIKTVVYENFRYDGNYERHMQWLATVWKEVARTLRPGGRLLINIDSVADEFHRPLGVDIVRPLYAETILALREIGLCFMGDICWYKQHVTGKRAYWGTYGSCRSPRLRRSHEYLLAFFKDTPVLEGNPEQCDMTPEEFHKWTVGHWYIPPEKRKTVRHPAPFPEALAERVIKLFSYRGDFVLDPFCGSGTVPVTAHHLGRRYVGIDNSPSYLGIAKTRLAAVS